MAAVVTPQLSSTQLQAHYDEVMLQMPVLPLSILPRPLASSLANLDAAAAKLARKAAASLTECEVCSCSSQPEHLQLLCTTKLAFHTRAVHATAAHFVCEQCAAVSCSSTLLQLLTPPVGVDTEDEQRSEQLHQLLLHFAAINNAPASITGNPDSLALWMQELACRAYSLSVVANSLKGWTLQPAGASTVQVLQQLLGSQRKTAAAPSAGVQPAAGAAAAPSAGVQPAAGAAAASASKHKRSKGQLQQAATPKAAAAGSKRLSSGSGVQAAVAAATAETPLTQANKKQKQKSAAEAAAQPTPAAKQQQLKRSAKKQQVSTPTAQLQAADAAPGLRTPQHSKIKSSSSKKQKLLRTAPR